MLVSVVFREFTAFVAPGLHKEVAEEWLGGFSAL